MGRAQDLNELGNKQKVEDTRKKDDDRRKKDLREVMELFGIDTPEYLRAKNKLKEIVLRAIEDKNPEANIAICPQNFEVPVGLPHERFVDDMFLDPLDQQNDPFNQYDDQQIQRSELDGICTHEFAGEEIEAAIQASIQDQRLDWSQDHDSNTSKRAKI